MHFAKAHAYGNDFLYVDESLTRGVALDALAREMCDRHRGAGGDGLIVYRRSTAGAVMRLINADGSHAEVSGNGVRGLAALLLRDDTRERAELTVQTDGGPKRLTRTAKAGVRQTFVAYMGAPRNITKVALHAASISLEAVVMDMGNPQCVVLGELPYAARFNVLGPALERHEYFPAGTNVEFAAVEAPDRVRIVIWERGVGPTQSSGTGSCASLVAAAAYGGAARDAEVIAPGGSQRVEWREDGVYLTGWAEVLFDGEWLRPLPTPELRTP